jgi:hypothetical protein
MSKPTLKITQDFTKEFNDIIKGFKNDAVLVGIPETKTARKDESSAEIGNAAILAINEFGSPLNNIPPRPVMALGIRQAQESISQEFKKAAVAALEKGLSALAIYYERAGIIASNSVKKVINSQEGFKGPSEATLISRKAAGFSGSKALIVTGQLRNSITYVVNKGGL